MVVKTFYVMYQGKQLGIIKATNYKEARDNVEEIITIEQDESEDD